MISHNFGQDTSDVKMAYFTVRKNNGRFWDFIDLLSGDSAKMAHFSEKLNGPSDI